MTDFARWLDARMRTHRPAPLSVAQLANLMSSDYSTVRRWFTKDVIPSPDLCRRLARILKVEPEEILRHAGHLPPVQGHGQITMRTVVPAWLVDLLAELDLNEEEFWVVGESAKTQRELREVRARYEANPAPDPNPPAEPPLRTSPGPHEEQQ